jgi:hypothetical protein
MPRLSDQAKESIRILATTFSNRELKDHITKVLDETYSHAAIGRYKKKYLESIQEEKESQDVDTSEQALELKNDHPEIISIPSRRDDQEFIVDPLPPLPKFENYLLTNFEGLKFNNFMEKLESSESYAGKHLMEKLNVKGRNKAINKERVIRIIRDVLDVIAE